MHIVTRIIAMNRARSLSRQFREIERMINTLSTSARQQLAMLTMRELAQAGRCEFPHLYGTSPEQRYAPWGSGTEVGLARAHSDNAQVRMRGIALWLAVAFHETRGASGRSLEALHHNVLRVLRVLKQNITEDSVENSRWREAVDAVA